MLELEEKGHSEIVESLKLIDKLFNAIRKNNYSEVQSCIEKGVLINSKSINFETPIFYASLKGHANIVIFLLENNANVNVANQEGITPLHVAANIEIVKSLLKHGIIYNIENNQGKTPLDLSKDKNIANLLGLVEELFEDAKNGNVGIISKLQAVKPDEFVAVTNARNNQGNTLLQVAIVNKHRNIASKLLETLKKPDQDLQDVNIESRVKSLKF